MAKEKFFKSKETEEGTEVEIGSKKIIGAGDFGVASSADVNIAGRLRKFVVKEFGTNYDAEEAFKNYRNARAAGLKVFNTYRIDQTGRNILMSSVLDPNKIVIGSNDPIRSLKERKLKLKEGVTNLDEFLGEYFKQAEIASVNDISIDRADVPFFIIDKNNDETQLDFVLADMDNVKKTKFAIDNITRRSIYEKNVLMLEIALREFFNNNFSSSCSYFSAIDHYVDNLVFSSRK